MVLHANDIELEKQWFRAKLASEKSKMDVIDLVKKGRGDFVLVDARDREAFAKGHLPGAISLPLADVENGYSRLEPEAEHVIYCWHRT